MDESKIKTKKKTKEKKNPTHPRAKMLQLQVKKNTVCKKTKTKILHPVKKKMKEKKLGQ